MVVAGALLCSLQDWRPATSDGLLRGAYGRVVDYDLAPHAGRSPEAPRALFSCRCPGQPCLVASSAHPDDVPGGSHVVAPLTPPVRSIAGCISRVGQPARSRPAVRHSAYRGNRRRKPAPRWSIAPPPAGPVRVRADDYLHAIRPVLL